MVVQHVSTSPLSLEWRRRESNPRDIPHERDAIRALALHLLDRFEQTKYEPLDEDGCIFLTVSHMQRLLRRVGVRRCGEKAATEAISFLCRGGILEDTAEVKLPRRRPARLAAREKFAPGDSETTGGRDAQRSLLMSHWWRVFRVVPLAAVLRIYKSAQGAYGRFQSVPQALASLSAWAESQGLISRRRQRRSARPGSVQYVFAHSGPP
jgi:hypothetical protein